jgi:hypothetical protein
MIGAVAGGAVGSMLFRYRCECLHKPTSSRILFTVGVPVEISGPPPWDHFFLSLGSAGEAIAKRLAAKWIEQTGIGAECVLLGVVAVTDKMSVLIPPVVPVPPVPRHRFSCRMGVNPCGTDSCWYA